MAVCSALEGMEVLSEHLAGLFYAAFPCQENLTLLPLFSVPPEQNINYFNYLYLKNNNLFLKKLVTFYFYCLQSKGQRPQGNRSFRSGIKRAF